MTPNDLTTARRQVGSGRHVRRLLPALLLVIVGGQGKAGRAGAGGRGSAVTDPQNLSGPAINGNPGSEKGTGNPAAKSATRTIPEPPSHGAEWTAPATRLPTCFVEATAALFQSGVADPRGCQYLEIDFKEPGWDGWVARKAREFVLPERPGVLGTGCHLSVGETTWTDHSSH